MASGNIFNDFSSTEFFMALLFRRKRRRWRFIREIFVVDSIWCLSSFKMEEVFCVEVNKSFRYHSLKQSLLSSQSFLYIIHEPFSSSYSPSDLQTFRFLGCSERLLIFTIFKFNFHLELFAWDRVKAESAHVVHNITLRSLPPAIALASSLKESTQKVLNFPEFFMSEEKWWREGKFSLQLG